MRPGLSFSPERVISEDLIHKVVEDELTSKILRTACEINLEIPITIPLSFNLPSLKDDPLNIPIPLCKRYPQTNFQTPKLLVNPSISISIPIPSSTLNNSHHQCHRQHLCAQPTPSYRPSASSHAGPAPRSCARSRCPARSRLWVPGRPCVRPSVVAARAREISWARTSRRWWCHWW